jgi:hypothetical protein
MYLFIYYIAGMQTLLILFQYNPFVLLKIYDSVCPNNWLKLQGIYMHYYKWGKKIDATNEVIIIENCSEVH